MGRGKRHLLALSTLVVALALFALPQLAAAGTTHYKGRISQPVLAPSAGGIAGLAPTSIEFKLVDSGFGPMIWQLRETSVYFHCTDGSVHYPADSRSSYPRLTFEDSMRVKKGKFSAVNDDGLGRIFTAKGTIPNRGPAKGTIRITEHVRALSDPIEGDHPAFDCDTGALRWTANRSG